ncbi:conserved Plasmodium protein, unknown function [Plasmodium berghei]|uniref:Uncharacterized protein n=2 Tax=Plasmodium berghei TaxID=5821 RepID=A0A509AFT4_PLABA|nr:conserved Plasmodium protein, unknown function [Plasmodium berghei ANKA]CXI24132.1 conserved Plasmodium protein, unknown function [Plasmodium berghei]VUC55004.1 conserved Plasmodium protein, unknown function [Plasmodium berghei ANKA]|eukprot:XP_034420823.1 conserved Plasmodium protein, unknown function [Plasmodium berghei ANKA]
MKFLYNVQLFQKGIEEIKLMKKLIYGKIDISSIENEGNYMTKLAKIKLLNEKNKKYNDLAISEKIKSCSSKKGKKSRSNSSSNGNKKGGKNEDTSNNNQSSENHQNNENKENANNGSNGSSNSNDGSDDGEDKGQNNNFIENDSDNEEEEENQKQKSETNENDNQNENNSEIKNNIHSNKDEILGEIVYEQNNMINLEEENEENEKKNNIINRSDSSIKEYSYEDSRIEACIYENIKTGNDQISNDKFNENKKYYYGNPFTASSCEDAMKMSMANSSFDNSNEINQDKNKTNKAAKKIKFQDEKNNDDKNPPQYTSFIKHYVTNVGDNNKHILKNYMLNFPIESKSSGFNKLNNETNSLDYNSLSSIENKKKCCNIPNFCRFGGNNNDDANQNKSNNTSKGSFEKYESNAFKTTKSNASVHPGYYGNFNYKNIFNTIKKYDCTNPTNYIQNYNCMKNTHEFIKNHSIEEGIEFIKNNVDFEKIKTSVDIENIARSLTMDSLRQNLSIDIIKNKIDINKISKQLNIRHIISKIYIKNAKKNINFQTIKKFIDVNQITQRSDSFDGNYELEDLFANYIQTYVDNIKRTIDIQGMKNNYFGIFQSCNPQLVNTNYIKSAAKSIQNINSMYSNNKLNFSLKEHKKYIAFNQKKSVNLIKSFYSKKTTFVKKKIEVNKKFLNNYFNACMIDCNNDSEILGSNELAQNSFAEYQLSKFESSYPEQSMDLEDMRLKSFFKTSNYNDVENKKYCSGMCCGGAKNIDANETLNNEPSLEPEQSINLEDMRLKSFFKTSNYNDVENKKYCSGMCCGGAKNIDANETLNNEPSLEPEQSINLEDMRLKSFFKTSNYNDVENKKYCSGMCCGGAKNIDANETLNNEPSLEPEQSINLEDMRLKSFFKTSNYNDVENKKYCSGMCCGGAKNIDANETLNNEPSLEPEQSINLEDMRLKSFFKTSNYNDVQKKNFLSGMCCGGAKSMNYDEPLNNESTVHFDTEHSEACDCPHSHLKPTTKHEDALESNVTCFSKPNNNLRYMKVVLPNNEESDIIYDDRKKIFFDLDGNAYAHIVHNLYFNVKDKLIYEIYYVGEINYEQIRNSLIKFGNYMVTEKYAPCKIIMEMCKKFNNLMNNILGINKSDTYYIDRENLVEVIIK